MLKDMDMKITKIIMTDNHKRLNESGADSKFEKCFL